MIEVLARPDRVFAIMAFFALAYQYYSDLKKMEIDSRKNWAMQGALSAMVLLTKTLVPYVGLLIATMVFNHVFRKTLADGDTEILLWLVPGTVMLGSLVYPAVFMAVFMLSLTLWQYLAIKKGTKIQGTLFMTLAFWACLCWNWFAF